MRSKNLTISITITMFRFSVIVNVSVSVTSISFSSITGISLRCIVFGCYISLAIAFTIPMVPVPMVTSMVSIAYTMVRIIFLRVIDCRFMVLFWL